MEGNIMDAIGLIVIGLICIQVFCSSLDFLDRVTGKDIGSGVILISFVAFHLFLFYATFIK